MAGMEAAALVIGIVSLYNACIDVADRIDAYKNFGTESQATIAQFEASKIRLQDWADKAGIRNGVLADHHDARLDDPQRTPIIIKILQCLKSLFNKLEKNISAIEVPKNQRSVDTDDWFLPFDGNGRQDGNRQTLPRGSRFAWSMGKREKLNKDVVISEGLISALYHVVDPVSKGLEHLPHCMAKPRSSHFMIRKLTLHSVNI